MLRDAQCGFEGNDPMVCCVNQVIILLNSFINVSNEEMNEYDQVKSEIKIKFKKVVFLFLSNM